MELTGREKDEGDFFGIRALEAGYYAGVAQSRPTSRAGSRAGSVAGNAGFMSTSTLVGGAINSLKEQSQSVNSSVTTLPLAHTKERNHNSYRDSDTLPSPQTETPARRKSPPAIRLAPSTAELTGRHRLSAGVDMNRSVPPSPTTSRGPSSPKLDGPDSDGSDGRLSPLSPRSPMSSTFTKPEHYAPNPPQLPMPQPEGFRASFVSMHEQYKSQAGSLLMASPLPSGASSPAVAPTTPDITLNESAYLEDAPRRSPVQLLPKTYQPSHQRDDSDASNYSDKRQSTLETNSNRKSVMAPPPDKYENRKTLAPGANPEASRYSEIFNAYYRNSMLDTSQNGTKSVEGKAAGIAM